jgi:hypothetical protein
MPLSADSKVDQISERRQRFQVARCDASLTGAIHCTVFAAPDDLNAASSLTTIDGSAGLKRTASKPPRRRSS